MPDSIISLHRARLAGEKGTIIKDWGGKISVALVFPNIYHVGMSNLGFQVLYGLLNDRDDVAAERVFLPEEKELSLRLGAGKTILSLESQVSLTKFDLIAFSLSFENDYPNILKILDLAGIPFLKEKRDETYSLVMAGGITSFLNPEPISDFIDFFLLGEAEENLYQFIDLFKSLLAKAPKEELIKILAEKVKHLYVPSLYGIEYNDRGAIGSRKPLLQSQV